MTQTSSIPNQKVVQIHKQSKIVNQSQNNNEQVAESSKVISQSLKQSELALSAPSKETQNLNPDTQQNDIILNKTCNQSQQIDSLGKLDKTISIKDKLNQLEQTQSAMQARIENQLLVLDADSCTMEQISATKKEIEKLQVNQKLTETMRKYISIVSPSE